MSTEAEEKLEQRAERWKAEVMHYDCECSDEHLAAFCRAELEKAAQIANYAKDTFDDSDDEYGFTRSALDRVRAAIRQRML